MLIHDTKACTDCVISNLEDNTNYNDPFLTYYIYSGNASGSTSSGDNTGLAMYNVLINSNYDEYSKTTPGRAINVLIQNKNKSKWDFGDSSDYQYGYPYVYGKSDIEDGKVTVNLLNNNRKECAAGSYLPWSLNSKGSFYLIFDAPDSDLYVTP